MNKKSFFFGVLTGIVLTSVGAIVYGLMNNYSEENSPIQQIKKPVSYENKKETSFKVFQVLENLALASEQSEGSADNIYYNGNTVVIFGEDFYNDQIIKIKNPQRLGTYSYTTNGGMPMTVPIIDGDIE